MALDNIYIGTAGFGYRDWLGNFYPQFCPAADFLRCYAMTFPTVELDSTFYRIPTPEMIKKWVKLTPGDFKFAARFPRTVTHEGDLNSRLDKAERFLDAMRDVGDKLGPLLLQFPPGFKPDRQNILQELLAGLGRDVQVAVEFRDRDWLEDDIFEILRRNDAGLCLTEYPGIPPLKVRTSDLVYVRFLGDRHAITEDFSYVRVDRSEELSGWEKLLTGFARENVNIYVYFNNHYSGHAPSTALEFRERLESGLSSPW